jgi:hypothetical protein
LASHALPSEQKIRATVKMIGGAGLHGSSDRPSALRAKAGGLGASHRSHQMKKPRHSSYPMPAEEAEELAAELSEFGYRETSDPDEADRRRFYKVEKWDADELHVEALLHANSDRQVALGKFGAF